ncbi:MmcQ/YjbR family DNA-binding protein [Flavobacterium sp. xlx-214]|uniref:MmcQ/YjbR family DNA-binding protein n=1 Tax=unclassified Flavobacterium TaxID=196869 RepID=UPI0013D7FFB8|nr:MULTISPECIES: MmcQ/YjbR family DNA-binding protein [unclassified Flavobacterium]MBA5792887.1 MmcQ/YjbR family DNA-binding protein [Flavobacterium sp. xlx-221]QMI84779.1 MmcQ/YjbR family DNA-binding protein [Flavobacterium sp. xlx-214]
MDIQQFLEYCVAKKGVTEHFPFDQDTLVLKVGGKMFLLTSLEQWEIGKPTVNLKCNPEYALELRERYQGVEPGWHMNKVHWNTVTIHDDVPKKLLLELIDHSYELIFKSLTKKLQAEILAD